MDFDLDDMPSKSLSQSPINANIVIVISLKNEVRVCADNQRTDKNYGELQFEIMDENLSTRKR